MDLPFKTQKVTRENKDYPERLRHIIDPPRVLYYWGNWQILRRELVAVVGTRKASAYGEAEAFRFAKGLSTAGVTVVSGLAFGIDKAAHLGALESVGGTVAVVAQSIQDLKPCSHWSLAKKIVEKGGLILSEKRGGEPYFKTDYLIRNRIIAGLCRSTLVVEAPLKSGAMNTAYHAMENHREVYALPGRINDELSRGTNRLIQTCAHLVTSPKEILEDLNIVWSYTMQNGTDLAAHADLTAHADLAAHAGLTDRSARIFEVLEKKPASPAELSEDFDGSLSELYKILSELEMKGLIKWTAEHRYAAVKG